MDSESLFDFINLNAPNAVLFVLSASVIFCFIRYQELNQTFRRLFVFLIWNLFIELLALAFVHLGFNNLPLLHLYSLGEFILFSWFFESLLDKPTIIKKYLKYFVLLGSVLIVLNSAFLQSVFTFNTNAKTFIQISIIAYAVLFFYNLVEKFLFSARIYKSLRLVNSAIIIYYSGSLFVFMGGQFSFIDNEAYKLFWVFNSLLNLIFQLLIFYALWRAFYKKTAI